MREMCEELVSKRWVLGWRQCRNTATWTALMPTGPLPVCLIHARVNREAGRPVVKRYAVREAPAHREAANP